MQLYPILVPALIIGAITGLNNPVAIYKGNGGFVDMVCNATIDFLGLAHAFGTPTLNPTWWYLSLAVLLIFVLPPLIYLVERTGSVWLLAAVLIIPGLSGLGWKSVLSQYCPVVAIGIVCAQYSLLDEYSRCIAARGKVAKLLHALLCLAVFAAILFLSMRLPDFRPILFAVGSVAICLLSILVGPAPILEFIGVHSGNIFMFHTFIYSRFLPRQLYSLHNWMVIFVVLVAGCLVISYVLELLKKHSGYNAFCSRLYAFIDSHV